LFWELLAEALSKHCGRNKNTKEKLLELKLIPEIIKIANTYFKLDEIKKS
jgi:division protein CdvB (Snf7/Vps24/ESCRT-III family)